jgi:hypothetical protein
MCHQQSWEKFYALLACVLGEPAISFTGHSQMAFIVVAGICLCLYFLFLCFMVFQVFRNISGKQSSLPAMSKVRRLHYEVSSCLSSLWNRYLLPPAPLCKQHPPEVEKLSFQTHIQRFSWANGKCRGQDLLQDSPNQLPVV